MKKFLSFLTACFISSLLSAQVNYYVAENGDDTNDGLSASAPLATLTTAKTLLKAEGSATEYIINLSGTITEKAQYDFNTGREITVTIKGDGASSTILQQVTDEEYSTTANVARFFNLTNTGAGTVDLTLIIEDITIKNFGFEDANGGALVNQKNKEVIIRRCNIQNGKARSGAIAQVLTEGSTFTMEDCYVNNIETINKYVLGSVIRINSGTANIKNCVFANWFRDMNHIVDENHTDSELVSIIGCYGVGATELNLINNTFYKNKVIDAEGEGGVVLDQRQSVVCLNGVAGVTMNATIANNLFIDNLREGVEASIADVDINLLNEGEITLTSCTNNVINASSDFPEAGNDINPSYTYTSSEINFTMDGDSPELFTTSTGVNYAKANGTSIFQSALSSVASANDITGNARDAVPSVGAYEAPSGVVTGIEASLEVDVALFPNPTSDVLYVTGDVAHISLYNITGTLVQSSDVFNGSVDVSAMPKGIYSVKCENTVGAQVATLRLIKK